MTVTVQDTIERQLVIPVGRQRVWEAITATDQIAKNGSSDTVTMELKPGSPIVFQWNGYGERRGRVEAVEPPTVLPIARFPRTRPISRFHSTRFPARWWNTPSRTPPKAPA